MAFVVFIFLFMNFIGSHEEDTRGNKFEEIVYSQTFVDKTLFIKLFLEEPYFMYVTAPRGFGKSTNLEMLKSFLNLKVDADGFPIVKNSTRSFKCFSEPQLVIFNETLFFQRHFGNYPVLHFRFKELVIGNTSDEFIASFRDVISRTFEDHRYLLRSNKLSKAEKSQFNRLRTKSDEEHPSSLTFSGRTLTSLLFTHFNRSCIVLIDDFDDILPQILTNEYAHNKCVTYILNFLRSFLAFTVNNNSFLAKILITACVRLLPPETAADAVGIKPFPYFKNGQMASFYGFTETEVVNLVRKLRREKEMDSIRERFCCYSADESNVKVYNILSITEYLRTGNLSSYWSDSGKVRTLKPIFEYGFIGSIIDEALSTNSISIALPYGMSTFCTEHVIRLKAAIKNRVVHDLREVHKHLFLKYVEEHGYFTVFRMTSAGYMHGKIPNLEVREKLESYIYTPHFFIRKFDIPTELIRIYIKSLEGLDGNVIGFKWFAKAIATLLDELLGPASDDEFLRLLYTFADGSGKFLAVRRITVPRPHLLVISDNSLHRIGIIVGLNYNNNTAVEALSRIIDGKYYKSFDEEYKHISVTTRLFLGLQLSRKMNHGIVSYLCNSIDIDNARTVDVPIW